jgi:hypothetical protein
MKKFLNITNKAQKLSFVLVYMRPFFFHKPPATHEQGEVNLDFEIRGFRAALRANEDGNKHGELSYVFGLQGAASTINDHVDHVENTPLKVVPTTTTR